MFEFRHFQNRGFRGNNQNTNTCVCILEMTLINSSNKKIVFYHEITRKNCVTRNRETKYP